MKCPNGIRQCPHNWTDCELCANYAACLAGTYEPESDHVETDLDVVIKAAEISEKVVNAEVRESVKKIRGTWQEEYMALEGNEALRYMARYRTDHNLNYKEPYKCMAGPTAPGGGGKCRVPKKPKKKMPEYLKTFGQ